MNISHVGIGTGRGLPFALAAALKVAVGQQATFTHYQKLVERTATPGECQLATGTKPVVGPIVDVSPKGDSCTIESEGFEWVPCGESVAVSDIVTVANGGVLMKLAALTELTGATDAAGAEANLVARETAHMAGIWQVDQVKTVDSVVYALIDLEARL